MNAAIDAGNTLIKIGIFNNDQLTDTIAFTTYPFQNIYSKLSGVHFTQCILSSVVALPDHILNYLKSKSDRFVILDEKTPIPLQNKYKNKQSLGKDRIALAVAGAGKYPGQNVLVINAGTCITYNMVTASGAFSGGAISPGLHMRLKAMHEQTNALPLPDLAADASLIENTTDGSLLSGTINGIKFEIEGFATQIRKKYKNCEVILSGGDSRYLAGKLSVETDIEPDLGLTGLNLILQFNAPEKN